MQKVLVGLDSHVGSSLAELAKASPTLSAEVEPLIRARLGADVEQALAGASAALRSAVTAALAQGAVPKDAAALIAALGRLPDDVLEEAQDARPRLAELAARAKLLRTSKLGENPALAEHVELARLGSLLNLAALPSAKATHVTTAIRSIAGLDDHLLGDLVKKGDLTETEARTLGTHASLSNLLGDDAPLLRAAYAKLGSSGLGVLASLDTAAWTELIRRAGSPPTASSPTPEARAEVIAGRVAALMPTRVLLARLFPGDLTTRVNRLPTESADQQTRFANRYPGLGLASILGDAKLSDLDKAAKVNARLALMQRVHQQNPELELVDLDYSPDSADLAALKLEGASEADRKLVIASLKAYQRVWTLAQEPSAATRLLEAGYTSSSNIYIDGPAEFAARTGLAAPVAQRIFASARSIVGAVSARAGAIIDVIKGGYDGLQVHNLQPGVADYLKKLDGFAELFGSQANCKCEDCESILSPAAYFVDLMCFVRHNVSRTYFSGTHKDHPLHLSVRRPDLWHLELTCANTNDLVPTLDIVNRVLENYIVSNAPAFTGSLGNRHAVEEFVYHQTFGDEVFSHKQPFALPLVRLDAYLDYFGHKRTTVAETLDAAPRVRHEARFGLSNAQRDLVVQPRAGLAFLRRLYGIDFQVDSAGHVAPFEARRLYKVMDISREKLGALVLTRFVREGAPTIKLVTEKSSPDSVQNDVERIHGLTLDGLDRMHRMARFQRRIKWWVGELDLVLTQVGDTTLSDLTELYRLFRIQDLVDGSVEELCALVGAIPRLPIAPDATALFDRLFNLPFYLAAGQPFPRDSVRFVHPWFRGGSPGQTDINLARLLGGLRVDDEDLIQLITQLATPLGAALTSQTPAERGFLLTVANLSLLYRHARLAESFSLSIAELFQLIRLAGLDGQVTSATELIKLLEFRTWWKSTSYTLDDLAFITGAPVATPDSYPDAKVLAADLVAGVQTDKALILADTVFAFFKGVTEAQSRAIITENSTLFEAVSGATGYWLTSAFTPSSVLTIPADTPVNPIAARNLVLQHHASRIIPSRLASQLSIPVDRLAGLLGMTGVDLDSGFTRVLQGLDPETLLADLIQGLLPLSVLFNDATYDGQAVAFVHAEKHRFAITDFATIKMASVRKLSIYASFARAALAVFTGAAEPLDPSDVRAVVAAFDPTTKFATAHPGRLARVLRAQKSLVATVSAAIELPPTPLEALDKLARCVALAQELGVSGDFLSYAVSDQFDDLQRAADAVLSASRAAFTDETEWKTALDPFEDKIRVAKRDALVDHLTRALDPGFGGPDALFAYLLIDVEAGGCSRTSWLVSAISSVQLYIERVLMNLEQDALAASDPAHVAVPPSAIPADEWTWRKNYRVWEANRVVFLYPESYIEPELRDDKTPLFETLEAALLQQDVTEQSVLDAYGTYLRGFDDVAKLKIAGAWHDIQDEPKADTLHLIGVAPGDPPVYYYRTAENLYYSERNRNQGGAGVVWSPWQPINVQISADRASPVVYKGRFYLFWTTYKTRSVNVVKDGGSEFDGYQHAMTIKFTQLRLDGTWTTPQEMKMPASSTGLPFGPDPGEIRDELAPGHKKGWGRPAYAFPPATHKGARDSYTLRGPNFDVLTFDTEVHGHEGELVLVGRDYKLTAKVGLYDRSLDDFLAYRDARFPLGAERILAAREGSADNGLPARYLHCASPVGEWGPTRTSYVDLALDEDRLTRYRTMPGSWTTSEPHYMYKLAEISGVTLISIGGNGPSIRDAIIQHRGDVLALLGSVRKEGRWLLRRIGTTLSDALGEKLSTDGVDALLATSYQHSLKEHGLPITVIQGIDDGSNVGKLDFAGPYGVYYREIFFQVPFLIANYLNSQGKYEAAQQWYKYIFDPTSPEVTKPARDRNWRYREFRHLDVPKLVDILTDKDALAVYAKDPFNPHAIARLRLSAYQKCIVMKYVDNLLDWGDSLFSEFTTESVNEAILLYITAKNILGPRPEELGDCGTQSSKAKTFASLEPLCKTAGDFLIDVETVVLGGGRASPEQPSKYVHAKADIDDRSRDVPAPGRAAPSGPDPAPEHIFQGVRWKQTRVGGWKAGAAGAVGSAGAAQGVVGAFEVGRAPSSRYLDDMTFPFALVQQVSAAFCVPPNADLLSYWDRVADRLYKIRNCMDIDGNKRQLALFAPEIDPRLLVRMKAAGLSLDDVLSSTSGDLPPYRFLFLIEKAKQYAGTLQGYGAALLATLEKKDGEELAQMRTVHQQNLLKMTTKMRQQDIDASQRAIDSLQAQVDSLTFKSDHYQSLLSGGLTATETIQEVSRHVASTLIVGAGIADTVAGTLYLIPQAGSPFAMKYGGKEMGDSTNAWAMVAKDAASAADAVANSAGVEAGFQRRTEEWQFQHDLAQKDLKVLARQLEAAQIRLEMANRSMELHQTTIDQTEEVYEFYLNKFSGLGLYTYLSASLQRLFRDAYNGAYAMAKLAEQAYRFERDDDATSLLEPSYWDPAHNGLLAGEQLLVDLQGMERRFIETNYRTLEVDQSFSLQQIAPSALLELRELGSCEFWVPEIYFDLFYPGQYQRKIKSVRLTIPSVTGPYTNVSATLSLLGSKLRKTASKAPSSVIDVPPRRSVSIATSTAQNDAGVFELSFRDERYMPFEGAGAISQWRLTLPKTFRPFDYQTINDVIVSIAYTASSSDTLRGLVETDSATLQGSLTNALAGQTMARTFSLRQDFSTAFSRLLHSPAGTAIPIEITDKFFPLFFTGRKITVSKAYLLARVPHQQALGALAVTIDNKPQAGFTVVLDKLGKLPAVDLGALLQSKLLGAHTLTITNAGNLAPSSPPPGDVSAIDATKLSDLLIYVEYHVA